MKLDFIRFELGKLGIVYENIAMSDSSMKLLKAAKYSLSAIPVDSYLAELERLAGQSTYSEEVMREIRDLLIFGEKMKFLDRVDAERLSKRFKFNGSVVETTVLLILSLHSTSVEITTVLRSGSKISCINHVEVEKNVV